MLATSTLLSLSLLGCATLGARSAPVDTLSTKRWNTVKECVTDVKVVSCDDFDCHVDGWHRIDHFLTLSDDTTKWNYVFYKLELDQDSGNCITDLKVVPEGEDGPGGSEWQACGVSAHDGVTSGGGPTIYQRRESSAQYAGNVVDLVVVRPGQYANKTEDFIREPINLGLGEGSGANNYSDWREFHSITSGYVWLEYTKAGDRLPITDVTVLACPEGTVAGECGADLISQGWNRRDLDLNGPTANGSHVYLFTSTAEGQCVTSLNLVDQADEGVPKTSINDGTDGVSAYIKVNKGDGNCITSLMPVQTSFEAAWPGYDIVQNADGSPANFNAGATNGAPIYIFTSTKKDLTAEPAPKQSFNSTGGYRIALYSDLHHTDIAPVCRDVPEEFEDECTEEWSYKFMATSLDQVKPDLVVIDGDLFAENERKSDELVYPLSTAGALLKPFNPILERGLPFAVTWGNHDAEGSYLRAELQRELARLPGFAGWRGRADLDGFGNYVIDIKKSESEDDTMHRLWFFDSRSYSYFGNNASTTGEYGGVHENQVAWFAEESKEDTTTSMAFFHIPLSQTSGALGLNSSAEVGVHGEKMCAQGQKCDDAPDVSNRNAGLFEGFVNGGSVKATFSGHDHSNDYAIVVDGITLTYDGSAGYTAYSEGDPNYNREMRVIDILNWGKTATSFKVIDDIFAGTVHRNETEPIVTLF